MFHFGRSISLGWSEAVALFGAAPILLVLISALVLVAVAIGFVIFLGLWTYSDANERTNEPALWTLIVLFVPGFIGLIIYLAVGRDRARQSSRHFKKPLLTMVTLFILTFLLLVGSLIHLLSLVAAEFGLWFFW